MSGRRNVLLATGAALVVAFAGLTYWLTRPRPYVDMARFAPATASLFIELDSLPDLAEGLTESDAWARLGKPVGLSSQLDYAGPLSELLGRLEMGPDDAVVLGRSQFAVVVTSVTAGPGVSDATGDPDGLVVRPRFALVVKTHSGADTAQRLARERLPALARKAYGAGAPIAEIGGPGGSITVAQGPSPDRKMVWAVHEDVVVLGNDIDGVRGVVDAATSRVPALAGSLLLERARAHVRADGAIVFAFAAAPAGGDVVGLTLGSLASVAPDPDAEGTDATRPSPPVAGLVSGISKGAAQAVGYAGRFEEGRFVERMATIFTTRMADALSQSVVATEGESQALALVPEGTDEVNVVRIQRPGETIDGLLTALSGSVDVTVSATVTQLAIASRRSFGATAADTLAPLIGDEVAFVDFGQGEPVAAIFEARDAAKLLPVVARYLSEDGARTVSEPYGGFEILTSSLGDGRAVAFIGRFVVYATRDQLVRMIDARSSGNGSDPELRRVLATAPAPILATARTDDRDAAELLLALSAAFRTSDGSADILEREDVLSARRGIPRSTSRWDLRDGVLVVETRSAVGFLSILASMLPEG